MRNTLFGHLLGCTYKASETGEPIERYFASMFADFYSQSDSQPSCSAVHGIWKGKTKVPRKLLRHYWDPSCPRHPAKLEEDLSALASCCFLGVSRCEHLRKALENYLQILPPEDRADLLDSNSDDDLIRLWTVLTWYALCGESNG